MLLLAAAATLATGLGAESANAGILVTSDAAVDPPTLR